MHQPNDPPAIAQAKQLLSQALVQAHGQTVGAIAALPPSVPPTDALNYGEVFIRDNVPVMVYLLLSEQHQTVRHFLNTCFQLQQQDGPTRGIFPTSFVEKDGELLADYGQRAIGRVVSVDASLWVPILAQMYMQHTGEQDWARAPQVQQGLERLLRLLLQPSFSAAPTLWVPDGAFMIDRPLDVGGAPLEIQVLFYGALRAIAALIQDLDWKKQARDRAQSLQQHLQTYYWIDSARAEALRRQPTEQYGEAIANPYNIYSDTFPDWLQEWLGKGAGNPGYLLGNLRTGRPDFRFFTLGNCLGAIFDVIDAEQQRQLFNLFRNHWESLGEEMPLRICHPPLQGKDWERLTGFDPKNRPWRYHNGGHWPCLVWFLAIACLRHPTANQDRFSGLQESGLQESGLQESGLQESMLKELEWSHRLMLEQLPKQDWSEYFDGPKGNWKGQQSRDFQTWTIVGLLLLDHFLANPGDAGILNLP